MSAPFTYAQMLEHCGGDAGNLRVYARQPDGSVRIVSLRELWDTIYERHAIDWSRVFDDIQRA